MFVNYIRNIWSQLTNKNKSENIPNTPDIPIRGTYQFDVADDGKIINSEANLDRLYKLFRDGEIIGGIWGPGRSGDFDTGSWHILCHLAAGSGVYISGNNYLWVSITHAGEPDEYIATVSTMNGDSIRTVPLNSAEGSGLIETSKLLGYIEGTSQGHILARNIQDLPTAFNRWPRQYFDRDVDSTNSGGTVWELWCPTRDIRQSCVVGRSVLSAYLTLVSTLGGKFVAAVARGRRSHDHPRQLCALVKAGFISREEALWDIMPKAITTDAERLFKEANSEISLQAVGKLQWDLSGDIYYYMFQRKIESWSKAKDVKADLNTFI
jgi:hypothetical protein